MFEHFPQDDQAVLEFLGILIESMRTVRYQHSLKFRTHTHAPSDAPRTGQRVEQLIEQLVLCPILGLNLGLLPRKPIDGGESWECGKRRAHR